MKVLPISEGKDPKEKPPVWEYTDEELAKLPQNVKSAVLRGRLEEKLRIPEGRSEGDFGDSKHISARDEKK